MNSTHSEEWKLVVRAYKAVGIQTYWDDRLPPGLSVYVNRKVTFRDHQDTNHSRALSTLARYLVAPKNRRLRERFGIGPDSREEVPAELALQEEAAANWLHVMLAACLFGTKAAVQTAEALHVSSWAQEHLALRIPLNSVVYGAHPPPFFELLLLWHRSVLWERSLRLRGNVKLRNLLEKQRRYAVCLEGQEGIRTSMWVRPEDARQYMTRLPPQRRAHVVFDTWKNERVPFGVQG